MPLFLDFLVAFNSQDQRINLLTSSGIELMESPGTPEPIPTLSWLESPEALEALLLGLEQDEEGIDLEASHEHTSDVLVELIHANHQYYDEGLERASTLSLTEKTLTPLDNLDTQITLDRLIVLAIPIETATLNRSAMSAALSILVHRCV